MKTIGRIRPSKLVSTFVVFVGVSFIVFALIFLVSKFQVEGLLSVFFVLLITAYHIFNMMMPDGVAEQEFDMSQSGHQPSNTTSVESRLETLQELRKKDLISEKEYQQKRRQILSKI